MNSNQNLKRKVIISTLIITLMISACDSPQPGGTPTPNAARTPSADLISLSAADLAKMIVDAPNPEQAVAATEAALAKGGVALSDLENIYLQAVEPKALAVAVPREVVNLALEARHRATLGRMTVTDLGKMLDDFGLPFQLESTPGEQMMQFLSTWVTEAEKQPDHSQNFTPLFIAEMVKHQVPSVDLTDSAADPNGVWLSLLELELFAAAFDRAVHEKAAPKTGVTLLPQPPASEGNRRKLNGLASIVSYQTEPCSALKKWLGPTISESGAGTAMEEGFEASLMLALKKLGATLDKRVFAGKVISAWGAVSKVLKLAAFYYTIDFVVNLREGSPNPVHKPLGGKKLTTTFVAQVGVTGSKYYEDNASATSEFEKKATKLLLDCMDAVGLTIPLPEDIARGIEDWRVEWTLLDGDHAQVWIEDNNFDSNPGHLESKVKRTGERSGESI